MHDRYTLEGSSVDGCTERLKCMHLLRATHTLAPLGVLSAQVPTEGKVERPGTHSGVQYRGASYKKTQPPRTLP